MSAYLYKEVYIICSKFWGLTLCSLLSSIETGLQRLTTWSHFPWLLCATMFAIGWFVEVAWLIWQTTVEIHKAASWALKWFIHCLYKWYMWSPHCPEWYFVLLMTSSYCGRIWLESVSFLQFDMNKLSLHKGKTKLTNFAHRKIKILMYMTISDIQVERINES